MKISLVAVLLAFALNSNAQINQPCDLWARYFPTIDPAVNGYSAGKSAYFYYQVSNTPLTNAWVARGFRDSWLIPGRVQKPLASSAGSIWVTLGDEHVTNPLWTTSGMGEYFVVRDGCQCSFQAPSASVLTNPTLVRTAERDTATPPVGLKDYAITRYIASGMVSIGKTVTSPLSSSYTNPSSLVVVNNVAAPNVLRCWGTDMWKKPSLVFGHKTCALWSKYKPSTYPTWPITHGFLFGNDINNRPGYVGRGNFNDFQWIGRVQTYTMLGSTRGVYVPGTSGEVLATVPEYLVVPYNCMCMFLPYSIAMSPSFKDFVVRSIDNTHGYAVGRVYLGGGKYALSSVIATGIQTYATSTMTSNTTPANELLVCRL